MSKRWQNRMAESRFALLTTALMCLPVWGYALLQATDIIKVGASMVCVAIATLLMAELNNYNALIRIYSRMVSSIFLVFVTVTAYPFASVAYAVSTLCVVLFYTAAFHCYQDRQLMGWCYYAFVAIGVHSLFFPHVLYFLPLLWVLMLTKLLSMSLRMFCASILGILTPYWFMLLYVVWQQDYDAVINHFAALGTFTMPGDPLALLTPLQITNAALVLLCAAIGIIHYLRKRQQDRIRTQLLYEIFIYVDVFAIAVLLLQFQLYDMLLPIIIVNTAPLIAHFVALTETKWTNLMTKALMLLALLTTLFNIVSNSSYVVF